MSLDASLLREHHCYFGGETAIVLQTGEYRESVDLDFMVSDITTYRAMRGLLQAEEALSRLFGIGRGPLRRLPEVRADQYGIRTWLDLEGGPIKFEIVFEARIEFEPPGPSDHIMGVPTLCRVDQVASKLLANVDRWADPGVMSRDIIDLAMLRPDREVWSSALKKAEQAYGNAVGLALQKAVAHLTERTDRLRHCIDALKITTPPALLQQNLVELARLQEQQSAAGG